MSAENSSPGPDSPKKGLRLPKISLGMKEKTIITIVVGIAAVALGVNSSIQYEAGNNQVATTHPPPTYTGSAPQAPDYGLRPASGLQDYGQSDTLSGS